MAQRNAAQTNLIPFPTRTVTTGSTLQDVILNSEVLYVRQKRDWPEILTNWEVANKYQLADQQGNVAGAIIEQGGGLGGTLARILLRNRRGFSIFVVDTSGNVVLRFTRNFSWFLSDIIITTPHGMRIGSAHRRFSLFWRKFDLHDPAGRVFGRIESIFWKLWTFQILDETGNELAVIRKRWSGPIRELFTNADTFQISFAPRRWKAHERAVILGLAMSIDFDFFEGRQNTTGVPV